MKPICIVCWKELSADRVEECQQQHIAPCCLEHEEEAREKQNERTLNALADIARQWQQE